MNHGNAANSVFGEVLDHMGIDIFVPTAAMVDLYRRIRWFARSGESREYLKIETVAL